MADKLYSVNWDFQIGIPGDMGGATLARRFKEAEKAFLAALGAGEIMYLDTIDQSMTPHPEQGPASDEWRRTRLLVLAGELNIPNNALHEINDAYKDKLLPNFLVVTRDALSDEMGALIFETLNDVSAWTLCPDAKRYAWSLHDLDKGLILGQDGRLPSRQIWDALQHRYQATGQWDPKRREPGIDAPTYVVVLNGPGETYILKGFNTMEDVDDLVSDPETTSTALLCVFDLQERESLGFSHKVRLTGDSRPLSSLFKF